MIVPKKCLVLLSHSTYSDIWELTMSSYEKFFEEKESFDFFVTTDALSNSSKAVIAKYNFEAIIYDKNISWGQSLLQVLDFLNEKNYNVFMFSFDDLVLTKPTYNKVNIATQFLLNNNVNYINIEGSLKSIYNFADNSDFFLLSDNNSYRGSLVFSLVDNSFIQFLNQMKDLKNLNAWEYEYRINKYIPENINCYSVNKPIIKFANTIIKGKVDPIQLKRAQRLVGSRYMGSKKRFTSFELLKFYVKTLFFRVFMYILPNKIFYIVRLFKKKLINNTK